MNDDSPVTVPLCGTVADEGPGAAIVGELATREQQPGLSSGVAAGVRKAAAVMLAIHKNTATVAHLHTHDQRAIGSISFTPAGS